ncbi:hypothetical protein DV738_g4495, partial [Chaetothyriales sp. CBS 135597]
MASMEHLIGQRFSLISKSQIRYEGILHEINPEQSTIALEDVYSFGTENRQVASFIPPTQQKYDYIVFRGSDVKDISIVEQDTAEEQQPSSVPNDPAILNSSRPPNAAPAPAAPGVPNAPNPVQSTLPPPGYPPQNQHFGPGPSFYPPPQQYGRGYGPPPPGTYGPNFNPYGPPPAYFVPPGGQGFPPGPGQFQQPPPPIGPPGQRSGPNQPPSQSPSEQPPARSQAPQSTSELPVDSKGAPEQVKPSTSVPAVVPTPSEDPKSARAPSGATPITVKAPAAQPKGGKIAPAIPFTVNPKTFTPPAQPSSESAKAAKPVATAQQSRAEIDEAQAKARQAVAEALAKVNQPTVPAAAPVPTPAAVDNITQKIAKLGTSPAVNGAQRGRGGPRGGRGFHSRGGQHGGKIEIPKSDYDFQSANAKFNKDDLIKEATSSNSPAVEAAEEAGVADETVPAVGSDSSPAAPAKAYNKATSFFDNISSDAKQREEGDVRSYARQQRGEEFKKNVETFGQGNVDGGYRGRGRGGYGRGRQYGGTNRGYNRGYNGGGYQGRGRGGGSQAANSNGAPAQAATSSW